MYAIRGKEERRGVQVCARFGIFGNFLLSRGGEISLDSNRGFPSRWMSKFGSSRCDRAGFSKCGGRGNVEVKSLHLCAKMEVEKGKGRKRRGFNFISSNRHEKSIIFLKSVIFPDQFSPMNIFPPCPFSFSSLLAE